MINYTYCSYSGSIFLDGLNFYYMHYDFYSDLGILNCEGDQPPSNDNQTNTPEGSNHNKGKRPKPDLHIDIGPKTELEKDTLKIGNCLHDKLSAFKIYEEKEVEETPCDFPQDIDRNGKPVLHKAFDSVTDNAFVCGDCHAIFCKDCVEDYSSSENSSPRQ